MSGRHTFGRRTGSDFHISKKNDQRWPAELELLAGVAILLSRAGRISIGDPEAQFSHQCRLETSSRFLIPQ
jgi:hypothetical protein